MNSNSRQIRKLSILKVLFQSTLSFALLPLLRKLLFAAWAASVCTFDRLFFRLLSFALHSFVNIFLPFIQLLLFEQGYGYISLLFKHKVSKPRAEASLLVIKISKKTSPQHWRCCFALKQNETKHKLILRENIPAKRE